MATIRQRDSGYWQAMIRRKGYPDQAATFPTKTDAVAWARDIEAQMHRGVFRDTKEAETTTFHDIADRYRREVIPKLRGARQASLLLNQLVEFFGDKTLAAISPAVVVQYRAQLEQRQLAARTVVSHLTLLSKVFKTAATEWQIQLPAGNPVALVKKPVVRNERTRRLLDGEEARLVAALSDPRCNAALLPIFRFAIETAARQSEILSLDWKDVDLENRVVRLRGINGRETKNGDLYREVPLSSAAVDTLKGMTAQRKGVVALRRGKVFAMTEYGLRQAWPTAVARARTEYERDVILSGLLEAGLSREYAVAEVRKVRPRGGPRNPAPPRKETLAILDHLKDDPLLVDLHFHDLRHEATSRLAEVLQMHELMKVTGHKGSAMLARYYHPRASDLAKKLAKG